jgi:hypothetical protein
MKPVSPASPTQPIDPANATNNHSLCPQGEAFALPTPEDHKTEFQRLQAIVGDQRQMGRQIIVVMAVGFVDAVMAVVVADSVDRSTGRGRPVQRFLSIRCKTQTTPNPQMNTATFRKSIEQPMTIR